MDCKIARQLMAESNQAITVEKTSFHQHFAGCPACQAWLKRWQEALLWIPVVPPVTYGFEERLAQRISRQSDARFAAHAFRLWIPVAVAASLALGLFIGSLTAGKVFNTNQPSALISSNYSGIISQSGQPLTELLNEPEE